MNKDLYNNEVAFELPSKQMDESRQGETLTAKRPVNVPGNGKKYYIESYGCAMNFADSEVVASILANAGFDATTDHNEADLVLINTCAIRDNAEQRIRHRLQHFNSVKKRKKGALVGILGCMAERLKEKLLEEERIIDIVAGPDAYRSLPDLVIEAGGGQKAVNVLLSRDETYAEINPVRLNSNGITAFISITRGCDNMCAFCVVPHTRGRERSRDWKSIVSEAKELYEKGYKEVTLLGQNVDSYRYSDDPTLVGKKLTEAKYDERVVNFAKLLTLVAEVAPDLRVRFSTSHPKDMTDDVLYAMAKYPNICKYVHLPVQSGSTRILELMNRSYTREWYLDRIEAVRRIVPEAAISTDIIVGFCTETEEDHQDTLSLLDNVKYELAYMYAYNERPGTTAAKKYADDVPNEVKQRRLEEVIAMHRGHTLLRNQENIGNTYEILLEGVSSKSDEHLYGRNSQNKVIVVPRGNLKLGQYVYAKVIDCTSGTLIGEVVTA
jgi:tRNA-2-methylthio-N6-dimethylallyladenosine synthase